MSSEAGEAMVWLSVVHTKLGRLEEARDLLERVLPEYALHGQAESIAALRTTSILAAVLVKLRDLEKGPDCIATLSKSARGDSDQMIQIPFTHFNL
jgi:hypothetical protein